MKNVLLSIVIIACLSGCYTDKKAQKQVGKALSLKPQIVAKIARDAFPCVTIKIDTTIASMDSTVYIDCPALTPYSDYFPLATDTVYKLLPSTKIVRVPVTLPVKTITYTKVIEDSAKIKLVSYDLQQSQKLSNELSEKLSRRNKLIMWLVIFLAGLSVPYIIKLVKLF